MEIEEILDEVEINFNNFTKFDFVVDTSDHHYVGKAWSRYDDNYQETTIASITNEWNDLVKNLPYTDSIFVRAYEKRRDLMRAVIVGPKNTPYCYNLFFFDICFPRDYPNNPPKIACLSNGSNTNPNLYDSGKVCLSLLDTLGGKLADLLCGKETNVLKTLVNLRTKVLNAESDFSDHNGVFKLSCKTMLDTLRRPPKHFEDFVKGHFRFNAHSILLTCYKYMNGGAAIGEMVVLLYKAFEANGNYLKHLNYVLDKANALARYEKHEDEIRKNKAKNGFLTDTWMQLKNMMTVKESAKVGCNFNQDCQRYPSFN
ncbi:Ubiquitin conjugating enzyme protein [Thalictrum thalictroides]|uniref:Ubiquitin conjugating enzyme protein n=1 Tax=Thalictrum thalictroides TaxID=46969 RepID=A0A7J6VYU5_THATH|nr:Ubiquitin conjugating enzyme protein [Thalictrum thalictroides]